MNDKAADISETFKDIIEYDYKNPFARILGAFLWINIVHFDPCLQIWWITNDLNLIRCIDHFWWIFSHGMMKMIMLIMMMVMMMVRKIKRTRTGGGKYEEKEKNWEDDDDDDKSATFFIVCSC